MRHLIERIGDAMAPEQRAAVVEARTWGGEGAGDLDLETLREMSDSKAELEKEIGTILGIPAVKLHLRFTLERKFVMMTSDDLVDLAGLFKGVFAEVLVKGAGEYSAEKNMVWLPIDVSWKGRDGGSNGKDFLTAWYEFGTKKWTFRRKA
jgi:hypothetical protein